MCLCGLGIDPKPKAQLRNMLSELWPGRGGSRFDFCQSFSTGARVKVPLEKMSRAMVISQR